MERGWAARAGTPSSILLRGSTPETTIAANHVVSTPKQASLPSRPFSADLEGRISEQQTDHGLVVVTVDGTTRGGFHGRLHLALRGFPVEGGGVQMTDSVVALLPSGAPAWWSGRVSGLEGTRIESDVTDQSGRTVHVRIDLRLGRSDLVTGSIAGSPLS